MKLEYRTFKCRIFVNVFLDLCEYENFIWIDWLKTVHTKSKCVLEPKLQNPLFDLVCLSFLCYFLFLEERDIKVMGNELKYKWAK